MSGRVFFTTTAGHTGSASKRARPGDSICVFYGGPIIYILRKKPDREVYEFIDECFTIGLMNGEAFGLLGSRAIKEQEFVIE